MIEHLESLKLKILQAKKEQNIFKDKNFSAMSSTKEF